MKIVDGFVWVAEDKITGHHATFGKNTSSGRAHYESLESNGITPFSSPGAALAAFEYLGRRRDLKNPRLAHLQMEIAEREADIKRLEHRGPWVVVCGTPTQYSFLGSRVEHRPTASPLPGAFLWANQLRPFNLFTSAEFTAREAQRQGGAPATIARFRLQIIKRL